MQPCTQKVKTATSYKPKTKGAKKAVVKKVVKKAMAKKKY